MSKILNCLFWKKREKNKLAPEIGRRGVYDNNQIKQTKKVPEKNVDQGCRRTSEPTPYSDKNPYKRSLESRKIRSYPVSPERKPLRESGYLTDQKANPYRRHSQVVYIAGMPRTSSLFHPKKDEHVVEPFPFEIPEDVVPRRSTLYYDMQYNVQDPNSSSLYAAEKPSEDYELPNTSERKSSLKKSMENTGQKRVTITTPYEEEVNNLPELLRKTVVRFRPHSTGSSTMGESVKFMALRASDCTRPKNVQGKYVHQVPFKSSRRTPPLMTIDGKPLKPLETDKIRRPSVISEKEIQSVRISVSEPVSDEGTDEYLLQSKDPVVPTPVVRRSVALKPRESLQRRLSNGGRKRSVNRLSAQPDVRRYSVQQEERRYSVQPDMRRYSVQQEERRYSIQPEVKQFSAHPETNHSEISKLTSQMNIRTEVEPEHTQEQFPYQQQGDPLIYAVPTVPTRGRSRSMLQQSVKSLANQHSRDQPKVYRKNIRYSMDTDVFSADTRRSSLPPSGPGYVNMEKGQPMLVSEMLNPITSLFVTNLKDPVPKDPLTKPREANRWVQPRNYSAQRPSISRPPPAIPHQKVYVVQEPKVIPAVPVKRRQSRQYYKSSRDDSSSDESIQVFKKKSKGYQNQHYVYAANIPSVVFPVPSTSEEKGKYPSFKKKDREPQPSTSKDFCGLNCDVPCDYKITSNLAQQTKLEDDILCYPSDNALRNSLQTDSNTKLKWRIIIKRGDEK